MARYPRPKIVGMRLLYNKCHARKTYESRRPIFSAELRNIIDSFEDQ
jgi:hypothetical protein